MYYRRVWRYFKGVLVLSDHNHVTCDHNIIHKSLPWLMSLSEVNVTKQLVGKVQEINCRFFSFTSFDPDKVEC